MNALIVAPPIVSSIGTSNDDPNVYLSEAADKGQNGIGSEPDHPVAIWLAGFGGRKAAGLDVLHEVDVGVLQILGVAELVVEVPSTGERDPGPGEARNLATMCESGNRPRSSTESKSMPSMNGYSVPSSPVQPPPKPARNAASCAASNSSRSTPAVRVGSGAPGPMSTSTRISPVVPLHGSTHTTASGLSATSQTTPALTMTPS